MPRLFCAAFLIALALLTPAASVAEDAEVPQVQDQAAPSLPPKPDDNSADAAAPALPTDAATRDGICLMVESAARANGLPLEFFARVIWQESRFQSDAIGPVTRSGRRAQGIAQFMPGTAAERRLLDPFDPVQALPKSAEFLSELRSRFGNLGLAAAAYNAGPRRVQEWIDGTGYMPSETRNYVAAITGTSVDDWVKAANVEPNTERLRGGDCRELIALLRRAPNPFVRELELRVKIAAASPWGVQLAGGFSRDRALATYARLMRRLSTVIGDRDPNLLSPVLRNRGTRPFYQVRIGEETRAAADQLCGRIRGAGQACIVLRNSARSMIGKG